MSLLSSPYLPARISRSSKTGVSIVTAPWRLKTVVMVLKIRSRRTISLPSPMMGIRDMEDQAGRIIRYSLSSPWGFLIGIVFSPSP